MFGKSSVIVLVLLAGCFASAAHSEFFKWVDKSGQVHYTQTPPPSDQIKQDAMSSNAKDRKTYKILIGNWIGKRKQQSVLLNFTADGRFEDRSQEGARTTYNGVGKWKVDGEMIRWDYDQGKGHWDYAKGKTKHFSFVEEISKNKLQLREPDGTITSLRRVGTGADDQAGKLADARNEVCNKPFEKAISDGEKWVHLIEKDCPKRVSELLKDGLNPNAAMDGQTPLIRAVDMHRRSIAKQLVKAGADVDKPREKDGATPLILAAQSGEYQLVNLLISAGASIEKHNTDKCTALIVAAKGNHGVVVKRLLSMGANVNAADSGGMTALKHAQKRGYKKIVKTIKDYKKLTGTK